MPSAKPTRKQADLADVLEMVLDKGIVINADIAITVGETEMIGVEIRAAIASFETAAEYGLAFPSGTDMRRVEEASGREPLDDDRAVADLGIGASKGGESTQSAPQNPPRKRPDPRTLIDEDDGGEREGSDGESDADGGAENGENDPENDDQVEDEPEANVDDGDAADADEPTDGANADEGDGGRGDSEESEDEAAEGS